MTDRADDLDRKRRIRRTLWGLVILALGFYVSFIVLSISRA